MDRNEEKKILTLLSVVLAVILFGALRLNRPREDIVLRIGVYAGSYWDTPNGDCYQVLDDAIALFEQEHPGVQVEYVSGILSRDYSEWLAEQIVKGTEPDVYYVLPEDFELLTSTGALGSLSTFIAEDTEFDPDAYYKPCMEAGQRGGLQYALPQESVPMIMFVNKTLLEENGIPMPDSRWTWEDFYSICAKVTDPAKNVWGVYDYSWPEAVYANGTKLFSDDGKACYLTDPNVQAAIRFIREVEALNGGYQVTSRDFDMGNVAFRPFRYSEYRAYLPYPYRVKKYMNFNWDAVPMPAGRNGANISELSTMLIGQSSRTKYPKLAWEFMKLLCGNEEIQREFYQYSRGISPLKAVAEDPRMLEIFREDMPQGSAFNGSVIHRIMSSAAEKPHFPGYDYALLLVTDGVKRKLSEEDGTDSGLVSLQREVNQFLNREN